MLSCPPNDQKTGVNNVRSRDLAPDRPRDGRRPRRRGRGRDVRPRSSEDEADQGRLDLHRAGRAAMGLAHPQGAQRREGARRRDLQMVRERRQQRLRAHHAPVCRGRLGPRRRRDFRRRTGGAPGRDELSEGRLPDGLVLRARRSRTSSVFDNFIHEPSYLTGMVAGKSHEVEHDRHGRRLRDPRGQPPDERLHGGRASSQPEREVPTSASSIPGTTRRRRRRRPSR